MPAAIWEEDYHASKGNGLLLLLRVRAAESGPQRRLPRRSERVANRSIADVAGARSNLRA